jgi:hypothetical protein
MAIAVALLIALHGRPAAAMRIQVHAQPADSSQSLAACRAKASPGDSLMLLPGFYRGAFTLRSGVSIIGIAGADSTIVDADGGRYVFYGQFIDSTTVISGLTIQNGVRPHANSGGGGIYLHRSSPHILNNVFRNHLGYLGSGVYGNYHCRPVIAFNIFHDNEGYLGGAVAAYQDCAPLVYNNVMYANQAVSGGGVMCMNSTAVILNNTIVGSEVKQDGGGVYCDSSPALIEANIIAYSKGGAALYCLDDDKPATFRRNLIWENENGAIAGACPSYPAEDGNCREDPAFLNAAAGDFRRPAALQSQSCSPTAGARHWDPTDTPSVPESIVARWQSWIHESDPR